MRFAINVKELEQSVTSYIATLLGKTVDTDVFRGGIPEGVETGVGVIIGVELNNVSSQRASAYELHTASRLFELQIIGKFNSRDDAWDLVTAVRDLFPVWNLALHDFKIISLIPRGDSIVYPVKDKGREKHFTSINLILNATPKTITDPEPEPDPEP